MIVLIRQAEIILADTVEPDHLVVIAVVLGVRITRGKHHVNANVLVLVDGHFAVDENVGIEWKRAKDGFGWQLALA